MKKSKKILLFLICGCIILLFILGIVNHALSKPDYADLVIDGKLNSYILVNDSQKYRYMYYYSYRYTPDLKIRHGKNMFLSLFKESFGAYSNDPERNFLYNTESGFGIQIVGLYAKESSLHDLFEPTPENIYRIVIFDKNDNEELSFNAENTVLFDYFLKTYSDELNDCFYPTFADDTDVFNEEYRIDIEYQNGEIARFLKCINKSEFEIMYSMNKL